MKKNSGETEQEHVQEHEEEEMVRKIKAGVEEEGFYKLGFERQKKLLKRIKFEEGEPIRRLVHNIMKRYGDEGFQLVKYVDFKVENVDEKSIVEIVGELEDIPIIRECKKLISRLIEVNTDKNEIEVGVDWEKHYLEEAKQRQAIEAELNSAKSKYERVLTILESKEYSEKETKRLFEMFEKKDLKNLTKSLSKDPSLIFFKDGYGNTLLHKGVWTEWIEGMKAVIELAIGIEGFIDIKNGFGNTPLLEACGFRSLDVIKFLISKGANIEAKNNKGETALMKAISNYKKEWVEFLVSKGANIEAKDNNGETALMKASHWGDPEIIKFLISKGANIEEKDNEGSTALMKAYSNYRLEAVKSLVSRGANIDVMDSDYKTAVMFNSPKNSTRKNKGGFTSSIFKW